MRLSGPALHKGRSEKTMYKKYLKRVFDFILSFCALLVLSPVLLVCTLVGWYEMKGNPFFTQQRPGKDERIFKLIKFRSMSNERDAQGKLLPDEQRLNRYGRFIRASSIDELPELINILKGDMAIVGPRPLLVDYLPWYNEREKHRHDIRPGLTGWAQVNGRNSVDWDRRFELDLEYVEQMSFFLDVKICLMTIGKVLCRSNVAEDTQKSEGNFAQIRRNKQMSHREETDLTRADRRSEPN